jgi:Protein of unknown function (DUF1573)
MARDTIGLVIFQEKVRGASMKKLLMLVLVTGCMLAFSKSNPPTGPMLSVDTEEFDAGTLKASTTGSVKHVFKIKNTGDSVLVIRDVRPG